MPTRQDAAWTDHWVALQIIRELNWDPRVDQRRVAVEVDRGIVVLKGAVCTYAQRLAATAAALRVGGVLDVVNDIQVHIDGAMERVDVDIAQAVRQALESDVRVPSSQVRSTVTDGWVMLEGEVRTWYERDAAEQTVHHLPGVRGVLNTLRVNLPYVKTETVRDTIEQALGRRAVREARHIEIDVRDGVVTLTGPVQSWAEREAVIGATRQLQGIREVEDHLHFGQTDDHPGRTEK